MTLLLVVLVLGAAILHATWNTLVKSGGSPEFTIAGFQLVGAAISLLLVPFFAVPAKESWPMIFASALIHNAYYLTLAKAYRAGDLGQVYPISRGLAPVLVALGSYAVIGEQLSGGQLIGVVIVCAGIMSLALQPNRGGGVSSVAVGWGLATSLLIACYTVVDGAGVRVSESRVGYILWLFIFEIIPIGCYLLLTQRSQFTNYLAKEWRSCVLGGIASSAAYGLVIFAMSLGAMAIVSSLRETSVIFAALIATFVLKEPLGRYRIAAAAIVTVGVISMQVL